MSDTMMMFFAAFLAGALFTASDNAADEEKVVLSGILRGLAYIQLVLSFGFLALTLVPTFS